MRVLVFAPYGGVASDVFAIALEIAQEHADQGHEVVILDCSAAFENCSFNLGLNSNRCERCVSTHRKGSAQLSGKVHVEPYERLSLEDRKQIDTIQPEFNDLDQLKAYRFADFDMGMSTASSLISMTRTLDLDMRKSAAMINSLLRTSASVYFSVRNRLKADSYDRVYLFNGRYAEFRAAMRACEQLNVPFGIFEFGHDLQHYEVYDGHMPHDAERVSQLIIDRWNCDENNSKREQIASNYYQNLKHGKGQKWESYTEMQEGGLLPDDWNNEQHNIVIFHSSDDEFSCVSDDWNFGFYSSQVDGTASIVRSLMKNAGNHRVYLRLHPNLDLIPDELAEVISEFDSRYFKLIEPRSKISSYALMEAADVVLTYGSTTGIEATFWGRPSVLIGTAFYRDLNATYVPYSHDETIQMLTEKLDPKPKEGALKYAYYRQTFGKPYKHVKIQEYAKAQTDEHKKVRFKDELLKPAASDLFRQRARVSSKKLRQRVYELAVQIGLK